MSAGAWGGSGWPVLAAAVAVDRLVGEPPEAMHPVVWMGRLVGATVFPDPPAAGMRTLLRGAGVALGGAAVSGAAAALMAARLRRLPRWAAAPLEGVLVSLLLSVRALTAAGLRVRDRIAGGDLAAARIELRWLVGRPLDGLPAGLLASAAIESLAENLADSVVAPLVLARFGGPGLAAAHRFVNTADAMVGYPDRHRLGGRVAARADDVLAFLPARLAALAVCAAAPLGAGSPWAALRAMRDDGSATPSPNSGRPMAAMAGALGVRLEKAGVYVLNPAGRAPRPEDVTRAVQVVRGATGLTLVACAVLPWAGRRAGARVRARGGHGVREPLHA